MAMETGIYDKSCKVFMIINFIVKVVTRSYIVTES